jgi:hypothetical protein
VNDEFVHCYNYDRRAKFFEEEHRLAKKMEKSMCEKARDMVYAYIRGGKEVKYK